MRQEDEDEEDGTDQHQGRKDTQIAQCRGIKRHQAGEGTHRRDVAYQQRGHHLLQDVTGRTATIAVGNEVQRIVDGNTDDDGTDTDDDQGHIAANDRDKAHGKQPSEQDGESNEQQVLDLTEGKDEQREYQRDGDGDGPVAVALDLIGITDSNDRSTRDGHIDIRNGLHGLLGDTVHESHQQTVVGRLHSPVGRSQHRYGIFVVVDKDVAIVNLDRQGRLLHLQIV